MPNMYISWGFFEFLSENTVKDFAIKKKTTNF